MTTKRSLVLIDMDGTLADIAHRLYILRDGLPHRWERFNARCPWDAPTAVVLWAQGLASTYDVVVVSARTDKGGVRRATEEWLATHGVPYRELLMRAEGDQRVDTEVKQDMLMWLRAEEEKIAFVVDDRPEVVEMWRREGLKVYPVHQDRWTDWMEDVS